MSLTKEQKELRRTRIGSSEVAALLGLDPYKTAHDVFLQKTLPAEDEREGHQSWGLDLEPAILAHHARKVGYTLLPAPGSLVHPALPLVCTPDALASLGAVTVDLQAKNDQHRGQLHWGEPGTDDAPLLYVAQVQVELGVLRATGRDVSHGELVVSIAGAPPVAYRIDFDPELFAGLAETAAAFVRDHLATGLPPPATPNERAEYIKRRWAKPTGPLLAATPEAEALVTELAWVKKQAAALDLEQTEIENKLKTLIGEAEGVEGLCTWKLQKGSTFTVTKKPGRVLRLAKKSTTTEGANADQ